MKTVLVISSFVAASRVGASVSAFCLCRLGHEAVILPTTLMGRHPGWGDPGGGAVDIISLRAMWEAIKAQDIQFDAVLSGYMGALDHIDLAAEIITAVKAKNSDAIILVDPVMGDHGRLYIPEDRAAKICEALIPLADIITPNVWEHDYLQSHVQGGVKADELITSVPVDDLIGAEYRHGDQNRRVTHPKFETVPHGGGDALAGLFLGHRLSGQDAIMAMGKSVAGVYAMLQYAHETSARELPLIHTQADWHDPLPLHAEEIKL